MNLIFGQNKQNVNFRFVKMDENNGIRLKPLPIFAAV